MGHAPTKSRARRPGPMTPAGPLHASGGHCVVHLRSRSHRDKHAVTGVGGCREAPGGAAVTSAPEGSTAAAGPASLGSTAAGDP
ncbi:hypothetical protein Ae717Ps2_6668 [Pseudonocardia sp. Ae717_Ps2]|nr:hypothetical protein Ae717Ps2_6668 [Pseudonocardia sp. Ae717_Ps2]